WSVGPRFVSIPNAGDRTGCPQSPENGANRPRRVPDAEGMFDPLDLLTRLGGLAQGTQLQDYGVTRMRLSKAVRSGEIERLRPGVFAAPGVAAGEREAARHGGALTCAAALRHMGVWVMSSETAPHVWVGHRGRVYPH